MNVRLWNYIKPFHQQDPTTSPLHLNYNDASVVTRHMQERVWTVMGLVVQAVQYADYDPYTRTFSNPVILERWNWTVDQATSFAIARTITVIPLADMEDLIPLVPMAETSTKFYTTYAMQLDEIRRRHQNMIDRIKEITLQTLVMTETKGNLKQAIGIGSRFIEYMSPYIQNYVTDGLPTLAEVSATAELRGRFVWLDNDMTSMGYPGKRLWEVLYHLLTDDTHTVLSEVDYDLYLNYI